MHPMEQWKTMECDSCFSDVMPKVTLLYQIKKEGDLIFHFLFLSVDST